MKWFPYGLDAPSVVRNLALVALFFMLLAGLGETGVLPPHLHLTSGRNPIIFDLPSMVWPGLSFLAFAGWMVWSSAFGKLREREEFLNQVSWRGDENVLDVGCGRGLLLIGAAKRLTTGQASGIDLWRQEDLSGNSQAALLENARREGVTGRISVDTGDMRALPYQDGAFDVIVTMAAIHNIDEEAGRDQAIREIARVLAPRGTLLIDDIRNLPRYAEVAREAGLTVNLRMGALSWALAVLTVGSLRYGRMTARRV